MKLFGKSRKSQSNSQQKSRLKRTFKKRSNISKLNSPYRSKVHLPKRGSKIRSKTSVTPPKRMRSAPQYTRGKIVLATVLSLGILGFGIYSVLFSDYFLIEDFQIEEAGVIIEDYEKMSVILQKILGQNLVLLNDNELISEIQNVHPEVDNIRIYKVFPSTVKIAYEKFPTVANLINTVEGVQKKFLIDSQGFLVEENTEHPDLPYIHYDTAEQLTVRSNFLSDSKRSQERLTQILNSVNLFEEKFGMRILFAEFKKRERELHLQTERYFTVMIDLEKDLLRQIEKLKKALETLDIYNEPLQYIDLRISGTDTEKVIFKRQ